MVMPDLVVNREPIKNQAAIILRESILTGAIKPGERIVPGDLALKLDTGRGVIREALIQLEAEGLVKNIPYRGSFVTTLEPGEMSEISSIRVLLESYALEQAAEYICEQDFQELDRIVEQMQIAIARQQYSDIVKYDVQFHGYFVRKMSRSVLYKTWDMTNAKLTAMFLSCLNRGMLTQQIGENHRKLAQLLRVSIEDYKTSLAQHYMRLTNLDETTFK